MTPYVFAKPYRVVAGKLELYVSAATPTEDRLGLRASIDVWNGDLVHADTIDIREAAERVRLADEIARLVPGQDAATVLKALLHLAVELPNQLQSGDSANTARFAAHSSELAGYPTAAIGPADAEALAEEVYAFLGRFVAYPSGHCHIAHTLWVLHAHMMDAWECTPRIAFLSPEPASGKTRALEVSELLVPRPVEAVNVTPAYLFRKVAAAEGRPTILYDEIDTVFGPKAKDNEEIRGLLNAGHRVGAVAGRCVVRGKIVETEEIPAYCAVALAGLGALPDTILSRSVIVRMRRRAPGEHVEPYRRRSHAPAGNALRDRIVAWAATVVGVASKAWPEMPPGIDDRDADLWEPLLTVADLAGGKWPARARVAAVALVADSKQSTPSLGIRLLHDLREVFGEAEVMATDAILRRLFDLEESPWSEFVGGKPLNARGLAQRLREYGVRSQTIRLGDGKTPKGYRRSDLWDAWARYLPPPPLESATSATTPQDTADADESRCSGCGDPAGLNDSGRCDSCESVLTV